MTFRNEFTEMFGVEHPGVCGGMLAVGTAEPISADPRGAAPQGACRSRGHRPST